ncbi:MAG: NAD(P)-dependent glycerol-3-phosphate dehydrogenase [Rhodobacteraceae bacterium]|nr:NAD(P)-dependent glycerol-3-phosphate dehydrogenase [Paracoccaceae bacterium]
MSIAVIGAGAFGTALAISLAGNGPVRLWSRSADHAALMRAEKQNAARLPGITLPENIGISCELDSFLNYSTLLLAVPMQQLRGVLTTHARHLSQATLVACCKGIELDTGLGPLAVISKVLPGARSALLTGPGFAADIAHGLPTALTLACKDEALGQALQQGLSRANLRLYRTTDTIGAELGGALKNVMAIACGAVMGAGLGVSARAALMTRGYAEMLRMAITLGAQAETMAGLSGFGDLALTCTSEQSRNYQLGLSIGQQNVFDATITVEGAATARAVMGLAKMHGIEMPITRCVVGLIDQSLTITGAMAELLARPLKEE